VTGDGEGRRWQPAVGTGCGSNWRWQQLAAVVSSSAVAVVPW